MAMLQQQRRGEDRLAGTDTVGVASSDSYVLSHSIASRRAMLAQSYYDDAKRLVSQALSVDESGSRMSALEFYNQALTILASGLAALKGESSDSTVVEIRKKMERMRKQVKARMSEVLTSEETARQGAEPSAPPISMVTPSPPPPGSSTASLSRTLDGSLSGTTASVARGNRVAAKADLVFHLDQGVSLMQVDNQDHVRSFQEVDAVSIFCYQEKIDGQPPAFLQCGDFVYPLVPGCSPVLKGSDGLYMFPELRGESGCMVGLVLTGASKSELQQLEKTLTSLADVKSSKMAAQRQRTSEKKMDKTHEEKEEEEEEGKETPTWGSAVAGGIDRGVAWVSGKISQGTDAAGSLISQGAGKLRDQIEPNDEATVVPVPVKVGVHVTRKASGYVVGVSDFLMTSLARLTVYVGKEVMTTVAESKAMQGREVNPHVKEAWKVTKSSVKGASAVFSDLEKGAVTAAKKLGTETAKTVEHKYGEDAGQVTDDSLCAAGNIGGLVYTYWSWKTWGIQFLGKVGGVIRKQDTKTDAGAGTASTAGAGTASTAGTAGAGTAGTAGASSTTN